MKLVFLVNFVLTFFLSGRRIIEPSSCSQEIELQLFLSTSCHALVDSVFSLLQASKYGTI